MIKNLNFHSFGNLNFCAFNENLTLIKNEQKSLKSSNEHSAILGLSKNVRIERVKDLKRAQAYYKPPEFTLHFLQEYLNENSIKV